MKTMNQRLAGVDYQLAWSNRVYDEISELAEEDFNAIRSAVFNAINEINVGIGKPPAFYKNVKKEDMQKFELCGTIEEFNKASETYTVQFDLEFNERISRIISKKTASRILYAAAKCANSKVELGEIDEAVFLENVKPGGGYLYIVVAYISWTYSCGAEDADTSKKSGEPSFLKKFMQSLLT